MQVLAQSERILSLVHESLFTVVPDFEKLMGRGSADETRVNETGEAHTCIIIITSLLISISEALENAMKSVNSWLCRRINTRDVARGCPDALEVPDSLASLGEVVGEEASAVLTVEDSSEAPLVARKRAEVENLNYKQVSGHRSLALRVGYSDWPTQVVHLPIGKEIQYNNRDGSMNCNPAIDIGTLV